MERKWYRSKWTKIVLIVMSHLLTACIVVGFWQAANYPQLASEVFRGNVSESYEESGEFNDAVLNDIRTIKSGLNGQQLLETDGQFDKDKLVDIEDFYNSVQITGENRSGLAFTLSDILDWGSDDSWVEAYGEYESGDYQTKYSGQYDYVENTEEIQTKRYRNPIVCKRSDGTYHYYQRSEFKELVLSGKLQFLLIDNEEDLTLNEILEEFWQDTTSFQDRFRGIQDDEGKLQYIDCWIYDGYLLDEKYAPAEADSVLQIVNENPHWNGRLSDAYRMIMTSINTISNMYSDYTIFQKYFSEGNTNCFYAIVDAGNGYYKTNRTELTGIWEPKQLEDKVRQMGKYVIVRSKLADFRTNMANDDADEWKSIVENYEMTFADDYIFVIGVDTSYPIHDSYYKASVNYTTYGASVRRIIMGSIAAFFLLCICIVWLVVIAGRTDRGTEIHLCKFDGWKTELAALTLIIIWWLPVITMAESGCATMMYSNDMTVLFLWLVVGVYSCAIGLTGILSLARRIKAKTVWKNSLLKMFCGFAYMVIQNLSSLRRVVVLYGGFMLMQSIAVLAAEYHSGVVMLWFFIYVIEITGFVVLIRNVRGKEKLRIGIEKIAGGEVDYKIDTRTLQGKQKEIAEAINTIGSGLDAAVEKSMKSERLKTDLITNVSHDIKTPLTSIINYVNLLKNENFEDPKIRRYIEILEQKAERLKTLTEDVVEASKVSSGNITLEYMNINMVEMIQQTSGEFEEKFQEKNLQEILTLPEEELVIRADGRRMWRILGNIYNNAYKYAMDGTRVYADLKKENGKAIFSLKNISKYPLNFSADELTERFIRGDLSRSSEGSGLGLSIAKTLTTMQGGTFELYLDGDLFKVTITFPVV